MKGVGGSNKRRTFAISSSATPQSSVGRSTAARTVQTTLKKLPSSSSKKASFGFNALSSTRKQSVGGGAFGGGGGRRSSVFGKLVGARQADPRPLSDKDYQKRMASTICEFLETRTGVAINADRLKRVRQKQMQRIDLIEIFEMIYQEVDSSFKFDGRVEEVLPKMLFDLGYPFEIKKSAIQACSSTNAAPQLLGALSWMVTWAKTTTMADECLNDLLFANEIDDAAGASGGDDQWWKCDLRDAQTLFTTFVEIHGERENGVMQVAEQKCDGLKLQLLALDVDDGNEVEDIDVLRRRYESIGLELKTLTTEDNEDEEAMLADEINKERIDTEKLLEFLTKIDEQKKLMRIDIAAMQARRTETEQAVADLREEVAATRRQIANQPVPGDVVRRQRIEIHETDRQIKQLQKEQEQLDRSSWTHETAVARQRENIEAAYKRFVFESTSLLETMYPGVRKMLERKSPLDPAFVEYCTDTLKPSVRKVLDTWQEELEEGQAKYLALQKDHRQLLDCVEQEKETLSELQNEGAMVLPASEQKKKATQKELEKAKRQVEHLQQDYDAMQSLQRMSVDEKQQQLTKLQNLLKEIKEHITKETVKRDTDLAGAIRLIVEYLDGALPAMRANWEKMMTLLSVAQTEDERRLSEAKAEADRLMHTEQLQTNTVQRPVDDSKPPIQPQNN